MRMKDSSSCKPKGWQWQSLVGGGGDVANKCGAVGRIPPREFESSHAKATSKPLTREGDCVVRKITFG